MEREEQLLQTNFKATDIGRLIEDLKCGVLERQINASYALGKLRASQAIPALLSLFPISSTPLKIAIANAIGQIGDDSISDTLASFYLGSFELKFEIISALEKIGGKSALKCLQKLYTIEKISELKRRIVWASGSIGDPSILPWFESVIKENDSELLIMSLKSALKIDAGWTIDKIRKLLISSDTLTKTLVLQSLPEIPDFPIQGISGELLDIFNDEKKELANTAAACLALIGDNESVRKLRGALNSDDPLLVRRIMIGIRRVGDTDACDELIPLLESPNRYIREDAVETIYKLSEAPIFEKIFHLLDSQYIETRSLIIRLLGKLEVADINSKNAVEHRINLEKSEDIIGNIFASLSVVSDQTETERLVTKAFDYEISQRFKIILGIQNLANRKSMAFLHSLFQKDNSEKIRAMIIATMGLIGSPQDVHIVKCGLEDKDPRVRANAIESLDLISSDDEAVEFVVPFLQDFNNRVKANAAMYLWNKGGLRMLSLLEKMLKENPDHWHRASAAYALGEIGNLQAQRILLENILDDESVVRTNIIRALGKIGDKSCIPIIIERFHLEVPQVREQILIALSILGGKETHQLLLNTINSPDIKLRNTALDALKKNGDSTIIPELSKLIHKIDDPSIISGCIDLLGVIGDEQALPILKEFLENDDLDIQTRASNAYALVENRIEQKNMARR